MPEEMTVGSLFSGISEVLKSALNEKDLRQSGLWSVTLMQQQYSENDFPIPRFMGILQRLILEQFNAQTSSLEDSHAKTYQMLVSELASRGVVVHSGSITPEPFAWYDQNTQSWRTFQRSLEGEWMLFKGTWPKCGLTRNGIAYRLPQLVRLTVAKESSLLPTPVSSDATTGAIIGKEDTFYMTKGLPRKVNKNGKDGSIGLARLVKLQTWPTPTVADTFTGNLKSSQQKEGSMHSVNLSQAVKIFPAVTTKDGNYAEPKHDHERSILRGVVHNPEHSAREANQLGQLTPEFCEWLMGFPIGWSELSASETQSYQRARKSSPKQ